MPTTPREYRLEPEVAGGWGRDTVADTHQHPPIVSRLHYDFARWSGDDIVQSFPVFLVSEQLAQAIEQEALLGVLFDNVKVTKDPQFERFFPDTAASLPSWRWLRPTGEPHTGDFWQRPDGNLVISERALMVIRRFKVDHCEVVEI